MEQIATQQLATLLDLDARHDDLLHQLDLLDQRVVAVLKECQVTTPSQDTEGMPQNTGIASHTSIEPASPTVLIEGGATSSADPGVPTC